MDKICTFLLVVSTFMGSNVFAQEGLAPLQGNEVLQWESKTSKSLEADENLSYAFKLDTNHLPIIDDFSINKFKQYSFDTLNTLTDTLIWQKFLVDGVYLARFAAMTDTAYYYFNHDTVNGTWDSVATPVVYITNLSQINYQMVTDTDTVWARQDTLVVGGTVRVNHSPDIDYVNFSDTVIVVPDNHRDTTYWRNNNALHNYSYGHDPVTLGVATFDGLDSTGVPYDPTMNPNSQQIADVLESKPIFLKTRPGGGSDYNYLIDSVYFSFQYQPEGWGDTPEGEDSLVLEFYSPFSEAWYHVWSAPGSPLQPFKTVMIRLRNPLYFLDGFKFRFKNYASVSGNFDHWNIDYVRLDDQRTAGDSTIIDVALMDPGYSLLTDYSQMPWLHYQNTTDDVMKTSQFIRYRNVGDNSYTSFSEFIAYDNGSQIFTGSQVINPQFGPLEVGGETSTFSGVYPTTGVDTVKSFTVKYVVDVNPDLNPDNDTAFFHQQFGTQYAYDDGSAESAYFVTSAGAQIAVEYNIAVIDTLRAINIYFPRSFENIVDRAYRLVVWKSLDPELILYESFLQYPVYAGGRDLVQGIKLEEPIEVSGQIFIGLKQLDKRVFIGLDRNNDSQGKNFYKVGNTWNNSSYPGSLFIRPEFGSFTNEFPVSVKNVEVEPNDFKMYPNPANSNVSLELLSDNNDVVVRSLLGVIVRQFQAGYYASFDSSSLASGLYVVEVIDSNTQNSSIKKLLIQH
ncbi:MAG: hypothetical protein ACJA2N_001833 [Salibacteraceae bacterium]|jgi:hypothetical protein